MSNDYVLSLTPTEFEKYCFEILKGFAKEEKLKDFTITHSKKIKSYDGTYQIDVYAEFIALSSKIKVLCECKQYSYPINREKVVVLKDKLSSTGAHKGILLSTSEFQSGAIKYALAHGIALIKVEDHTLENYSFSNGNGVLDENDPLAYGVLHMPPVVASVYSEDMNEPQRIYPTRAMIGKLLLEQTKRINEAYGTDIRLPFIVEEDE